MGRPAKFDRETAIEVVMNEIWKNGFKANSVKSISEKLGITRSSFYNAFESREALFMEAMQRYSKLSPDYILNDIDENTNITATITKLFRNVCHFQISYSDARGCMVVNSMSELVSTNKDLGPTLEGMVKSRIDRFENLLEQAIDNGEIKDTINTRNTAIALENSLLGLNLLAKTIRSEQELWNSTKQILTGLGVYNDSLLHEIN